MSSAQSQARVVVIGGGIAGLATAALLARGGASVTVLERHGSVGGRVGRWAPEGYRFDTGASWYFMPEVIDHFFRLFGTSADEQLDLVRLDPAYRVFFEPDEAGAPDSLDLPAEPERAFALAESIEPGAGQALRRYAADASNAYGIALRNFLYTTYARPDRVVSREVLRGTGTLLQMLARPLAGTVERAVGDPRLRQMLGYHAVFLGSSPYRVPSFYQLMSHLDLVDGVRYPQGGLYGLIEAIERLARAAGVEIRTGAEVAGIEVEEAARTLRAARRTGVARGVRLVDGTVVPADVVVSAADLHHTETALLPERHRTHPEPRWSRRSPGISSLLVMAGVRGALPELAHHTLFFTRDWPANFEALLGTGRAEDAGSLRPPTPASIYVSRTSATDPGAAPEGHENLFVLVPFPANPAIGAGPDGRAELEALADRYLDQVGAWAGIDGLRERVVLRRVVGPADFEADLHAWQGGSLGLEHTLAQSAMFRPANVSARVPNLLYAGGSTLPGIGLPMCLISAELVAKRLLGETSAHPLPAPLRPGFLAAQRAGLLGAPGARGSRRP